MRRLVFNLFIISASVLWLAALVFPSEIAQAQVGTVWELIDAVNGVRTANGLPALEVDAALMSSAQATADIMASSGSCAHIGNASGRAAAAGYGGGAKVWATENIACGQDLSIQTTVYSYWADATHMIPMVNASYTHIGGGVTVVNGRVYYVIHAAYTSGSPGSAPTVGGGNPSTPAAPRATIAIIQPVITSTPNPDGSVVHEVKSGQALWSIAIAYGIKIADLIELNKLGQNTVLVVGQTLVVQAAYTPTLSPTPSLTPLPPTRTPSRTPTPRTPTVTFTPSTTITPTPAPLIDWQPPEWIDQETLGMGLVVVSGAGLLFMLVSALRKKG